MYSESTKNSENATPQTRAVVGVRRRRASAGGRFASAAAAPSAELDHDEGCYQSDRAGQQASVVGVPLPSVVAQGERVHEEHEAGREP